jgi:hypothetical protein
MRRSYHEYYSPASLHDDVWQGLLNYSAHSKFKSSTNVYAELLVYILAVYINTVAQELKARPHCCIIHVPLELGEIELQVGAGSHTT